MVVVVVVAVDVVIIHVFFIFNVLALEKMRDVCLWAACVSNFREGTTEQRAIKMVGFFFLSKQQRCSLSYEKEGSRTFLRMCKENPVYYRVLVSIKVYRIFSLFLGVGSLPNTPKRAS